MKRHITPFYPMIDAFGPKRSETLMRFAQAGQAAAKPVATGKTQELRLRLASGAVELLHSMASESGLSSREYLETLLHYAGSCHKRPDSWEGSTPFDLSTYTRRDSAADRWF